MIPTAAPEDSPMPSMPLMIVDKSERKPLSGDAVANLTKSFAGCSPAGCYLGPSGLTDDGIPWLVIVTTVASRIRTYRGLDRLGALVWMWNITPSSFVSITLVDGVIKRPYDRWFGPRDSAVVRRIAELERALICIAHPDGQSTGWFDARTDTRQPAIGAASKSHRDRIFDVLAFKPPGISNTEAGKRIDLARVVGFLSEKSTIDGQPTLVDECGLWRSTTSSDSIMHRLAHQHPTLANWLAALCGPQAKAEEAAQRTLNMIRDGVAIRALWNGLLEAENNSDDCISSDLSLLINAALDASFLDEAVTGVGRRRPYLKNSGSHVLEFGSFALDDECSLPDIEEYWRSQGLNVIIDGHIFFGPRDMPAPLKSTNEMLTSVRLDCTQDEAQRILMDFLSEAAQARQWSIPWGARVEVQIGPFVAMRICEHLGEFSCQFLDESDRYLSVNIGLSYAEPQVSCQRFVRSAADGNSMEWNDDASMTLKLIAAAIVRDFLVVEERESLFSTRPLRRRVGGQQLNSIIYLPRVRYSRIQPIQSQDGGAESSESDQPRTRHAVAPHLRRVGKASPEQRFLAMRYGVPLPQGFTFVRPHERGADFTARRLAVYRSKSASRMIFEGVSIDGKSMRPKWFDFEKDCARVLRHRSMAVIHQAANRDGDGGVDLFATDSKGQTWVVQCKCYAANRPVGPEVVRELIGAIALADRGSPTPSRGMIITTSSFTSGAASAAMEVGFEIVDGTRFARLLREASDSSVAVAPSA